MNTSIPNMKKISLKCTTVKLLELVTKENLKSHQRKKYITLRRIKIKIGDLSPVKSQAYK